MLKVRNKDDKFKRRDMYYFMSTDVYVVDSDMCGVNYLNIIRFGPEELSHTLPSAVVDTLS